jgi:hypothetical protein
VASLRSVRVSHSGWALDRLISRDGGSAELACRWPGHQVRRRPRLWRPSNVRKFSCSGGSQPDIRSPEGMPAVASSQRALARTPRRRRCIRGRRSCQHRPAKSAAVAGPPQLPGRTENVFVARRHDNLRARDFNQAVPSQRASARASRTRAEVCRLHDTDSLAETEPLLDHLALPPRAALTSWVPCLCSAITWDGLEVSWDDGGRSVFPGRFSAARPCLVGHR